MIIKFNDYTREVKLREKEYSRALLKVLRSGWYILGDEVKGFENKLAKYLEVKHCVGVANGLEAIQVSLMALGVGAGDEVITTPVSAMATTLAVLAVGATPVFADVNENGQMDTDLVENLITKKTKAVLPVHLYGQPIDIVKLKQICLKHKLFLIEDSAQAHGTTFNGRKVGAFGDVSCYSFYPTKNLGAIGDGGAIVTDSAKLAKICAEIRDYGQERKYVHTRYGLNSRLDELQAAILFEKLRYLNTDNGKRRLLARRYIKNLKSVKGINIILPLRVNDSNFHLFVVRTKKRDELKKYLSEHGVPTLIHFPTTIPDQPIFGKKYKNLEIPEARAIVNEVLSLPCHPFMKITEVDYVSDKIKEFLKTKCNNAKT